MMIVDYVGCDDWCGLYVAGKLEFEGHSFSVYHLSELVGDRAFILRRHNVNECKWNALLEEISRLPNNFGDLLEVLA